MAKTKIQLFEDRLIQEGVTDEALLEFETLLKHLGDDWNRIQHCFITAYRFPVSRLDEAVKLIEFGIDRFKNSESGIVCSYQALGSIYEEAGLYQKAYDIYVPLYSRIGNHKGNFPWCLLKMKLHIDHFEYSKEMEEYFQLCSKEDIISKSFLINKLLLAIADFIIAHNRGDKERMQENYDAICEMIEPGHKGPLNNVLKKHRYDERLRISDECWSFLESMGRIGI